MVIVNNNNFQLQPFHSSTSAAFSFGSVAGRVAQMAMTNDSASLRKATLKAVRGAVLSAHAAASLAAGGGIKTAEKLIRAAEGILRVAAASLEVPVVTVQESSAGAAAGVPAPAAQAQKKKKRRRKKKTVEAQKDGEAMETTSRDGGPLELAALLDSAGPGGSVLVGDLTELGISATTLVMPTVSSACSSATAVDGYLEGGELLGMAADAERAGDLASRRAGSASSASWRLGDKVVLAAGRAGVAGTVTRIDSDTGSVLVETPSFRRFLVSAGDLQRTHAPIGSSCGVLVSPSACEQFSSSG